MNFDFCCRSLAAIFSLAVLPVGSLAQDDPETGHDSDLIHGAAHKHDALEEVVVTATPLTRNVLEMSQSSTVLSGVALHRELHNNIGETLTRLPGLSNASFGQNLGRPVIRGLQGVRVGVLNDNMTSSDVSAVSQDHAIPVEPFLADQIEVLRGPATLIYGSGSIGGVVNVVSNTIPITAPERTLEGRVLVQGDTAADQRFAAGRLDFGSGSFAGHASAFYRRTDDYEIPGPAELFPDEHHDEEEHGEEEHGEDSVGVLENSFLDNEGGAVGASWIGETWTAGLSYTLYNSDYGIPGAHAHEHEHEEEHEFEAGENEENVTVGLENRRVDGLLLGLNPFRGFERIKLNLTHTDYTHTEFEGDEIGTVFDSKTLDGRLELRHSTVGRWSGAFGGQVTDRDFSAVGEEAFVPPSETESWALFWVESAEFERWRLDLGLRYENVDTTAAEMDHEHEEPGGQHHDDEPEILSRHFTPLSFSAAVVWHSGDSSHLALTFASAERAPSDAELFSFGPHLASQTFEVGDPDLGVETNRHYELAWRLHEGVITGGITLFHDDFNDYTYQADTGLEEDGLPLRLWSQQDAEFTGGELEVNWDIGHNRAGHWQLFAFYDRVKAELADGSNVPRIPPSRFGLGADWDLNAWAANVTWIRADDHRDTAVYETPTPGYDLVNAEISYRFATGSDLRMELYLKGHNLLDEEIRNSTSFLKDQAPQIGRNFVFGARVAF